MNDHPTMTDKMEVPRRSSRWAGRWKFGGLAVLAAGLIVVLRRFHLQDRLPVLLDALGRMGPAGMGAFVALYIAATVLFIPGSILTLGAGVLFGVVKGTVLVSVGATLGATAAFLIGRYLARGWVQRKIAGNDRFRAVDESVAREGWKIVLLMRLSPVFPFNLLNYAFGLTRISLKEYVLASWIGMLPGTVMYVYLGALVGDLAALAGGRRHRTPAEWVLYGVGLAATVAVTYLVTRNARRALARRIPSKGEPHV